MRQRSSRHAVLLLPMLLAVTACGNVLDSVPPRPAAIEDPATAEAAFPSLAAVPARPRLTYTLEQRREIAEGLVADRANARYVGDTLRQSLDRPVQPASLPPLPPAPATINAIHEGQADPSLTFAEEGLARDSDDGSLGDFLERLQQPPPALADSRTAALGIALPLSLTFVANDVTLSPDTEARLEQLAQVMADARGGLVVSGGGTRAGLAMERARRVAASLVAGGFPPARITIEMGGDSDLVVVYEAVP